MTIIEVKSAAHVKLFHQIPFEIYKKDSNWIPHIKQDIEKVFNEKENKFFRHGEATRWLLKNDKNMYVGRIAAFINSKKAFSEKQPTGGIGFFECINCNDASFKLFETAKNWLKVRKMEAMDGPINFGERDRYWGLLV